MNKHVLIASVVAPVLAVLSWFAVGAWFGEQAKAPKPGERYPLVAKSNCRYQSGLCTLENSDFSLEVRFQDGRYVVVSDLSLDAVLFAVGGSNVEPRAMTYTAHGGSAFWFTSGDVPQSQDRIYLVAKYQDALFFADAATDFVIAK